MNMRYLVEHNSINTMSKQMKGKHIIVTMPKPKMVVSYVCLYFSATSQALLSPTLRHHTWLKDGAFSGLS